MRSNRAYIALVIFFTALLIITLTLIPGYLKDSTPQYLPWQPQYIVVFLLFNLLTIIPAYKLHQKLTPDYTPIKNLLFFTLFGGITGALLGESGNPVMILPYSALMFIYAQMYKKYPWWKVALTSYFAGTLVESGLNRSPIQVTTLMWIAFFTYPYFITKVYENRNTIAWKAYLPKLAFLLLISITLGSLAYLVTFNNPSPPLILFGVFLPFLISSLIN